LSSHHKSTFTENSKYVFVKMPRNLVDYILSLVFMPKELRILERNFKQGENTNLIVPMATPFDLRFIRNLKSQEVNVIQIIHDSNRHPGDLWPNRLSIKKMIKRSNSLIFLSKYVGESIQKKVHLNIPSRTVQHPFFETENYKSQGILGFKYFLLIGRIEKYKGAKSLVRAWKNLCSSQEFKEYHLLIAGKGSRISSGKNDFRITRMNYWLTDSLFDSLIENASAVIFPYTEASQSGVMAKAILAQKFIASTDQPGLVEQLSEYGNKYIGSVKDLELLLRHSVRGAEMKLNSSVSVLEKKIQVDLSWIPLKNAIGELTNVNPKD
jgi:glycosyltransferase involved in cell wall biosynthesis